MITSENEIINDDPHGRNQNPEEIEEFIKKYNKHFDEYHYGKKGLER